MERKVTKITNKQYRKTETIFLRIFKENKHVCYGTLMQHRKLYHVASQQKLSQGTTVFQQMNIKNSMLNTRKDDYKQTN